MSKQYYSGNFMSGLQDYGIGLLTFEACSISLRGLFDCTELGLQLVERAFGITIDRERTPDNWNSKVGNVRAIASVRLSPSQCRDLLIYALAEEYPYIIYAKPRPNDDMYASAYVWGGNRGEFEEIRDILNSPVGSKMHDWHLFMSDHNHPRSGLDNTHAFTGRNR
jgi:hypothetical protein